MTFPRKSRVIAYIMGVSALALTACSAPYGHYPGAKTNHFGGYSVNGMKPSMSQGHYSPRHGTTYSSLSKHNFSRVPQFRQWIDYEPQYTLYPGDQVDIVVSSAPELSRTLTVGPDGRIVMPMIQPIMAAGRSFTDLQHALSAQLGQQLRDPRVAVTPRAYAPAQIFVGGDVATQGTYTLPGPIGVLEAIMMAGGYSTTARASQIAVLRRAPNGGMMMRTLNMPRGMKDITRYNDVLQLRRGDIIFVPRTHLGELANFMRTFRDALPITVNASYNFGNNGNNNDGGPIVQP